MLVSACVLAMAAADAWCKIVWATAWAAPKRDLAPREIKCGSRRLRARLGLLAAAQDARRRVPAQCAAAGAPGGCDGAQRPRARGARIAAAAAACGCARRCTAAAARGGLGPPPRAAQCTTAPLPHPPGGAAPRRAPRSRTLDMSRLSGRRPAASACAALPLCVADDFWASVLTLMAVTVTCWGREAGPRRVCTTFRRGLGPATPRIAPHCVPARTWLRIRRVRCTVALRASALAPPALWGLAPRAWRWDSCMVSADLLRCAAG